MIRTLLCCILCLTVYNGCSDNSVGPNVPSLIGTRNWIKSSGGFSGVTITPEIAHYTIKIVFTRDSLYKQYKNDTLFASASFNVRPISPSDPKSLEMIYYSPNISGFSQAISRLDFDTLILSDNAADGFTSTYSRIQSPLQANQSLKLTETAVDDFAARQYTGNDMSTRYVRAMNYMKLADRRRSLAPVR